MYFTVREFEDLITIIEKQPEWRSRLLKALFPDLDIAKAFQDLAETTKAIWAMVERMDARLIKVEHDVEVLKSDVSVLKGDVSILKKDTRELKGYSLENKYRNGAAGLFGLFLKNSHDVTNEVANQLYAALEVGTISENALTQVLAADLLWGGENRKTKESVVLVMEASWLAETHDVEQAAQRRDILRQIGLNALAVVGGTEWSDAARKLAVELHVVTTSNGRIDRDSWENALQSYPG
jgi:hypothetical protein